MHAAGRIISSGVTSSGITLNSGDTEEVLLGGTSLNTTINSGRIHIVPVPRMLVDIEPTWRGFLYFVYEDELVIVDPRDLRIVAVLPV